MPTFTRRYIHEVTKGGSLYFLLNGFNGAINKLAEEMGDGLHAIALALSTKEDNSAQILELANKVKTMREKLKASVDAQKGD